MDAVAKRRPDWMTAKETGVSVRIKLDDRYQRDFADILVERKPMEDRKLIYSWLTLASIGTKPPQPGMLTEDPGSEMLYRRIMREGHIDIGNQQIRPEDLRDIPDGSSDGDGGILVPIGERLLPYLRRSASVTAAMLRAQKEEVDFVDLQSYALRLVKERIDKESVDLARPDLHDEMADLFPEKKKDEKDGEKKP